MAGKGASWTIQSSKFAERLARMGEQEVLNVCIIDVGKGNKCLLLPQELCAHLEQEDAEYWQAGDFSLLEMLYPDWYDFMIRELDLKA